jgi:hypothetical protein
MYPPNFPITSINFQLYKLIDKLKTENIETLDQAHLVMMTSLFYDSSMAFSESVEQ